MTTPLISDQTFAAVVRTLGAAPLRNYLSIRAVFCLLGSIVDERYADALDQARRERSEYLTAPELEALIELLDKANEEAARTYDGRSAILEVELGLISTAPDRPPPDETKATIEQHEMASRTIAREDAALARQAEIDRCIGLITGSDGRPIAKRHDPWLCSSCGIVSDWGVVCSHCGEER